MVYPITSGLPGGNRILSPPGTGTPTRAEAPAGRQGESVVEGAKAGQQAPKGQALAAVESAKAGQQEPKVQELAANVKKLNALAEVIRRELHFSVHDGTDRLVIAVIDSDTGETIRQIPPEAILALMEHLQDSTLMVSEEA